MLKYFSTVAISFYLLSIYSCSDQSASEQTSYRTIKADEPLPEENADQTSTDKNSEKIDTAKDNQTKPDEKSKDSKTTTLELPPASDNSQTSEHNDSGASGIGQLLSISDRGIVRGWAAHAQDSSQTIEVHLYVDGDKDNGMFLTKIPADQDGADNNINGNHAFAFNLPQAYADGNDHSLFAYTELNGRLTLLTNAPMPYIAYTPTLAGQNYYNQTLRPLLTQRCANCHAVGYDQHYGSLLSPLPKAGGTALNNEMINYPAGGNGHPGGNICGNKNATPCQQIQMWWNLEFNF